MNNEIKEILKRLDKGIKKVKFIRNPYSSEDKKYKEVGIYLQEEQCNIFKDVLDYISNLEKENEILRKNAEHNDKVVDKAKWNEMIYKSRNKKAIEYILKLDKDYDINVYQEDKHWAMVLYILQGEDKDEK